MKDSLENPDLENLLEYIKSHRGFDFSGYKRSSLSRRISKRMQAVDVADFRDYLDYLEVHPNEFVELFNTILINVTSFFREPDSWNYIASEILPQIINNKGPKKPIRVWSAGCASGEETYTIAILLAEALGMEEFSQRVKVFATDVDMDALNHARHAVYTQKVIENISEELLEKYFEPINSHFGVQKELRRGVIFGRHDLVQDAPISRIDLLVCRNALMYFNSETQSKILDRFHFALNNDGYLFLGKAEMLFSRNHLFAPIDLRRRVFTKVPNGNFRQMLMGMTHSTKQLASNDQILDRNNIYEAVFEIDAVAQIVVDLNSTLILANSEARNLFKVNLKDIGRPLQDLEISYRPVELRSRIDQVQANKRSIALKDIEWVNSDRQTKYLDVDILPLLETNINELLGIKIIFKDITRFKQLQQELLNANQELETAYEELQSTNEELETTNEELQSTVEELETTNEELQSTNEELETMNEELQSTNEELQTMNEEIGQNSEELNRVNSFLESILTSMRSGVVVVNLELHILIWNYKAQDLWGLRLEEVFGQHLVSLDIGLPVQELRQPLREVINSKNDYYELTLKATNRRGKAIECQIRITPLINSASEIQGAILLMEESERKEE